MIQWRYNDLSAHQIEEALRNDLAVALTAHYGSDPDDLITMRMDLELCAMEQSKLSLHLAALHDLTLWAKESGIPYRIAGTETSSFLLYLLGITKACPLQPHYYCPKCHGVYWSFDTADGFDLPPRACMDDGAPMRGDGHDIPWQTFWGYPPHHPGFTVAFPETARQPLSDALEQHWIKNFDKDAKIDYPNKDDLDIFYFGHLCIFLEADGGQPTASLEEAKEKWQDLLRIDGKYEPPLPAPDTFADLVALFGLAHGVGVWDNEASFMHDKLGYAPHETICFRDDVFQYLLDHDTVEKDAWQLSERIRKGRCPVSLPEALFDCRDKWVVSRIQKVKYLCSKGVAVEHLLSQIEL